MSSNPQNTKLPQVINWFEIPVGDIGRASKLYEAMLDTKLARETFMDVPHALLTNADHSCVGGALVSDPKRPPKRGTGTLLFFNATDGVDRCLSRAVEAGAKVVQPATAIGPHGTIALVEDLDGNVIGLHENPKSPA